MYKSVVGFKSITTGANAARCATMLNAPQMYMEILAMTYNPQEMLKHPYNLMV